jgi:hypothetical protein
MAIDDGFGDFERQPRAIFDPCSASSNANGDGVPRLDAPARSGPSRRPPHSPIGVIAFGTAFLANPDLPQRYRSKAPLNVPDQATFYAGEDKGLTDYPPLAGALAERDASLTRTRNIV